MVISKKSMLVSGGSLSVLALSSRFDGHDERTIDLAPTAAFSTRSVESF